MIIVVGGIKGGSGKTTVATNLAVLRAQRGADLLLVDADEQETATDFTILRAERLGGNAGYTSIKLTGSAVRTQILRLADKYEDIVIDTGGRDTTSQRAALTVADCVLIPFVPRSFDVWTLDKVNALIEEMRPANDRLRAFAFLNRTDPRGSDNLEARGVLADSPALELVDTPLGNRKAFPNAAALGLAVHELRPEDAKASAELAALYRHLFDIIEP
jgi:chromosome partitioning protein